MVVRWLLRTRVTGRDDTLAISVFRLARVSFFRFFVRGLRPARARSHGHPSTKSMSRVTSGFVWRQVRDACDVPRLARHGRRFVIGSASKRMPKAANFARFHKFSFFFIFFIFLSIFFIFFIFVFSKLLKFLFSSSFGSIAFRDPLPARSRSIIDHMSDRSSRGSPRRGSLVNV